MHGTMTGTTQNAGSRGRTARAWACASVTAAVLLSPAQGWPMAADGALLTNIVSATYHGMAGYPNSGQPYLPKYTMSYLVTANILVSCPIVAITKRANVSTQSVDGTVTFEICAINSSMQASAWNIVITDALMDNMSYVGGSYASWAPPLPSQWTVSSASALAIPFGTTQPNANQVAPYFLRWTINTLGPARSACISFQTKVL